MAVFPGSYVPIGASSNARVNTIVDNMLTPHLLNFRQINIYDEQAKRMTSTVFKLTYPNWNEAYTVRVMKNENEAVTPASIDYILGEVTLGAATTDQDAINVTYNIDWFSVGILAGFIYQAIDVINNSGQAQSITEYTIDNAPVNWNGVITDLVVSMCMEKLLLDSDLWYGRVIFSIGADELNQGGGDITGVLETIKTNAEERAKISLDNEKFKIGNLLAQPTSIYYAAVRGIGGAGRTGGKLRGWKPNRWV